MTIQLFKH